MLLTQHAESPASRVNGRDWRLIQSHIAMSYGDKTDMTKEQEDILYSWHQKWLVFCSWLTFAAPLPAV